MSRARFPFGMVIVFLVLAFAADYVFRRIGHTDWRVPYDMGIFTGLIIAMVAVVRRDAAIRKKRM